MTPNEPSAVGWPQDPDSGHRTRVDFHHHLFPAGELAESVRGSLAVENGWRFPAGATRWTPETSLAFMNDLGIQTAVLSLPNDVESGLPARERRAFARQINTIARQTVDDHPGRFGFFAHLPTPPTSTPPSRS